MISQAARLVAFLSGNAAVDRADGGAKWWLDGDVQERLRLTPQQVQALDDIFTEAGGREPTLMLWRMYQTLGSAQREQFAQMLRLARANS